MNKFIVDEGLDACGKITLSSRYAQEENTTVHSVLWIELHRGASA